MSEMRMGELARLSGVSVSMIKYYIREGLLPPGKRTNVNQAVYDASHLERIRLIRALVKVAGLPLYKVREVVEVVDSQPTVLDAMAVTQNALVGEPEAEPTDATAELLLAQVIEKRGWHSHPESPAYAAAIKAVADLKAEDLTMFIDRLDDYAQAADAVGRTDLDAVRDAESLDDVIQGVVLGNVYRRILLEALVLLAQQHYASTLGWTQQDI